MEKNVLITGGAGFIGKNLCDRINKDMYNVTILDNFSKQIHGDIDIDRFKKSNQSIEVLIGNICDQKILRTAIKNKHYIIHLAAETGTGQSMYQIKRYTDANIGGTALLFDLLVNNSNSVEKIIVASSRAVYGEGKYQCKDHGVQYPTSRDVSDLMKGDFEFYCNICKKKLIALPTDENSLLNPLSIYGLTKYGQEQTALITGNSMALPVTILRLQNVFGPGQSLQNPYTGILSIFSTRLKHNREVEIYEDGYESRDFIYIQDVTKAILLSLEHDMRKCKVYNVGSGKRTTVLEVAKLLKYYYNSNSRIKITSKYRKGDIRHNYASIERISNDLNFEPDFDFKSGVKYFVDWVNDQDSLHDNYSESMEELKCRGLYK